MIDVRANLAWAGVAVLGAISLGIIALSRGETINAVWLVAAAICTYLLAYRFYSLFIAERVLRLDPNRPTPANRFNDGLDYCPTDRTVLFGHHFAAIAGAGPLVGPVLAAQMGYLPGTLWLLAGVVFAGAVQDFIVLWASTRRDGRSLGDMIRAELGQLAGTVAMIGVLLIMVILLAVLALVVVKALKQSPWATFTVMMTIPIAVLMGVYGRFIRPGRIGEMSLIGFVLLMLSIVYGRHVAADPVLGPMFNYTGEQLSIMLIVYGFVASVLPVWTLLAPRDYLSTFLKIGTIVGLALGIFIVMPDLKMPALTKFVDGTGPVFAGTLFPFLFITIACGAVSGFHSLVSSGTTPKMLDNELNARFIGYGAMLMESFVAIMALIAASTLEPGLYFAMNSPAAVLGTTPETAAAAISGWGFAVTPDMLKEAAANVGEATILSRTGGAPTLAVGMAEILSNVIGGKGLMAFWYHFAILFEALFILTTIDAGTRVARFMIQDLVGSFSPVVQGDAVVDRQHRGDDDRRIGMGLFSLSGRRRPAGRHQHAVAAVRHREPDACLHRADPVHRRPVQDEARALCVGDDRAGGMGRDMHADGGLAENLQRQPGNRISLACGEVRNVLECGPTSGACQIDRRHEPHRVQRLRQCDDVGIADCAGRLDDRFCRGDDLEGARRPQHLGQGSRNRSGGVTRRAQAGHIAAVQVRAQSRKDGAADGGRTRLRRLCRAPPDCASRRARHDVRRILPRATIEPLRRERRQDQPLLLTAATWLFK